MPRVPPLASLRATTCREAAMTGTVTPGSGRPALRSVPDDGAGAVDTTWCRRLLRVRRHPHRRTSSSWNPRRLACVQTDMTEDERERIAELHFDGDPAVLAELRRDPKISELLDSLDLVVWELELLRNTI